MLNTVCNNHQPSSILFKVFWLNPGVISIDRKTSRTTPSSGKVAYKPSLTNVLGRSNSGRKPQLETWIRHKLSKQLLKIFSSSNNSSSRFVISLLYFTHFNSRGFNWSTSCSLMSLGTKGKLSFNDSQSNLVFSHARHPSWPKAAVTGLSEGSMYWLSLRWGVLNRNQ